MQQVVRSAGLSCSCLAAVGVRGVQPVACTRRGPGRRGHATRQAVAGAFLTGRFAAMQGDLDFAADEFLRALAADPASLELRQQAFLACLMVGRPEAVRLAQNQPE